MRGRQAQVMAGDEQAALSEFSSPLPLDELVPGTGPWEVELGFGKGRYLLARALANPERRFLGIERAGKYFRLARDRARRKSLRNLVLMEGEALFLLSVALPAGFAEALHVYFPDPWPKARHHRRRFLDADTLDLVLRVLMPGGRLYFATDHTDYGEQVHAVLASHPDLSVHVLDGGWPEGPRTNYEAKYVAEGRPILRLEARIPDRPVGLHPGGAARVLAATAPADEAEETEGDG